MDVLPGLLGDKEFSYFTPTDYMALKGVLNDTLASHIKDYTNSPMANPSVVSSIQQFLGPTIESLTFHEVLIERGIPELIQSTMPQHLATSGIDLDELLDKLTFLEENEDKLLTTIPARSKEDWKTFLSAMSKVESRMRSSGDKPTYTEWIKRIEANSRVFYAPREKERETGNRVFSTRKRQWMTTLRGAQYIKRCEEENIPYHERRKF